MSRDAFSFDPQDPREAESRQPDVGRGASSASTARALSPEARDPGSEDIRDVSRDRRRKPEATDSPQAYYLWDRTWFVRDSEFETLTEIGTFRMVAASDLAHFGYLGDSGRMEREARRLKKQGLLSEDTIATGKGKTTRIFILTKAGKRLIQESGRLPATQAVYHGLGKPREAEHDAELYRLYQNEIARIERAGGRPLRVVLDYELKRKLNRDLAALEFEPDKREARERIARDHGLSVVNGKILMPDLRVEYETVEMDRKHVDLELATRNYRPRALAEKAQAGFSLYAPREDASRLRRILYQRQITAEISAL